MAIDRWYQHGVKDGKQSAQKEMDTLRAERDLIRDELRLLKGWQLDVEEREAAVCPEDVGFDEYIKSLRAEVEQWKSRADQVAIECQSLRQQLDAANARIKELEAAIIERVDARQEYETDQRVTSERCGRADEVLKTLVKR
jgi:chromosome segregation ATPase